MQTITEMQKRVDTIDRLHQRVGVSDKLLFERRSLLRLIHNIPASVQLPLDWKPQ
jgi:hypothetical protein